MVLMLQSHLKKAIIPFLDELSIEAKSTQSVNTIYLKENKVMGHNTDIVGFEASIKKSKYNLVNKEVLILGSWRSRSINNFCFKENESF
jgi:shikimate dehydrogenase